MKPTKWAETIIWQRYPKHKPEKDGEYLIVFRKGLYQQHSTSFYYCNDNTWEWSLDGEIVAFAELPTGEIGEEFGFETALLLMLSADTENKSVDGHSVMSVTDGYTYSVDGIGLHREKDGIEEAITDIPFLSILGKWRLA